MEVKYRVQKWEAEAAWWTNTSIFEENPEEKLRYTLDLGI